MDNLKTLKKLIALCQKSGITEIEALGFKFKIKEYQKKERKARTVKAPKLEDEIPSLTEEDLLFWSAVGQEPSKQESTNQ